MRILAVERDPLQLSQLQHFVTACVPEADFLSYEEVFGEREPDPERLPQIAFLDEEDMDVAEKLQARNPNVNLIILAGSPTGAFRAFGLHASGYLLKPVTADKIREEMEHLRFPVHRREERSVRVQCFGNFEVYVNGKPLHFERGKTKELFAYLIDRHGAACTLREINAILWDDDKPSYLRTLIADLKATLRAVNAGDIFVKRFNECFILPERIDCDCFDFEQGIPYAVKRFHGEYMAQYSWAEGRAENFARFKKT